MKQESERLFMIWSISLSDKISIDKIPIHIPKYFIEKIPLHTWIMKELFITLKNLEYLMNFIFFL